MRTLLRFLNPIEHLGDKRYPVFFPLFTTLSAYVLSEIFAYNIVGDPMVVGVYIIYVSVLLVIYFAFRTGIRGGVTVSIITVLYYFYIIYTRQYSGRQLSAGIETSVILGLLYACVALVIGWLKQTIDTFIEREANEKKRLQAILQQLPVGVLITDSEGRITQTNKQLETIIGLKIPIGSFAGDDMFMNAERNGKQVHTKSSALAQVLQSGKSVTGREFIVTHQDGKRVYINVSSSVIHGKRGQIIAAASIINDITAQKELDERKDDFVNMASHELKTPITSMNLYLDALYMHVSKYKDERMLKTLSSIKQQTERLQNLVNSLLDVSRLQTGKLNFEKTEFRLDTLVKDIIEELGVSVKKQSIKPSGTVPAVVLADRFRIYQVLANLIMNAGKYSPPDSVIRVKMQKDRDKVTVSITDSGIGIDKDQQKKIFDRLYQVRDPQVKTFPGLGMGLYISREIIKYHKGKLWVVSEKGKGSTFYFTLPLHKESKASVVR